MNEEENIRQELEEKFDCLKGAVVLQRKRRIFADIPLEKFSEVFVYAVEGLGFKALSAITGLDSGEAFSVIYHLNREGEIVLSLRVNLKKENPEINSVAAHFASADIYERELVDLLGIRVLGLAPGNRYPLPDNWPKDEHPLRKDWKGGNYKNEVKNE